MERYKIEGFSKYNFGLDGSVYSIKKGRFLSGSIDGGYKKFHISNDDNKSRIIQQHQIVYKLYNNDYQLFQGHKLVIGHLNSNGLDNSISNLQLMTQRENLSIERTRKSGLPVGVSICKRSGKFVTHIWMNNKSNHIGLYSTPEEASAAYQDALSKHLNIN